MKKLFLGLGAAALIMSSVSCGSGSTNTAGNDSCIVNNDSLSIAIGAGMGSGIANQIKQMPDSLPFKAKLSKDDIIKGLEYFLSIDTTKVGIPAGVSMGMQLAGQIAQMEQMGAKIDRKKVIEEFAKALKQDSVSMEEITKYQEFLQLAQGKLQAEAQRKYMEELEKKPEAIQGTKTGEAFIAKKKQEDAEIKTTASGLSYKIINEGAGDKAVDTSFVKVKYTGKLINDTVFDDSKGEAREFPVKGVVPGFSEGLKLLGKGGKAIFYIPGKLGYGAQGQPAAGIGPNATLVFEVEVVDIKGTATPQKPQNPVNFQGQPRPNVKVQGKK
ncbi:MAG: FKBP-type peptidyl-prolyl cis-trans isomerase [Muribaculaceae bacterium]|nr:FKBP-type peptidyl-prolyl cis-trans isomerase [Muribaculaceae bacterium]